MKTLLKKLLGIICIVIGGVLTIVPILPGFPLVLVGLELLGIRNTLQERFRAWKTRDKSH